MSSKGEALTTNFQLEDAAARNNIPLVGVFWKDVLPGVVYQGGYIFNLADHDDENGGTHWTAAWVERNDETKESEVRYFDPFGFAPPENIKRFFQVILKGKDDLIYSTKQVQNENSFICGYYVLYFLFYMCRMSCQQRDLGKRFKNFMSIWSNREEDNRRLLKSYLHALI